MNTDTSKSKQDWQTPDDFLSAVQERFGMLEFDLAAADGQEVLKLSHFTLKQDSLLQPWPAREGKLCWLNPPFKNIAPWAAKCAEHVGAEGAILMLTPASIGTEWYRIFAWNSALTIGVNPRITFKGCTTTYPKDLMLTCWGRRFLATPSFEVWRWK
jgi:phage N-6-adenine-methyltransferase